MNIPDSITHEMLKTTEEIETMYLNIRSGGFKYSDITVLNTLISSFYKALCPIISLLPFEKNILSFIVNFQELCLWDCLGHYNKIPRFITLSDGELIRQILFKDLISCITHEFYKFKTETFLKGKKQGNITIDTIMSCIYEYKAELVVSNALALLYNEPSFVEEQPIPKGGGGEIEWINGEPRQVWREEDLLYDEEEFFLSEEEIKIKKGEKLIEMMMYKYQNKLISYIELLLKSFSCLFEYGSSIYRLKENLYRQDEITVNTNNRNIKLFDIWMLDYPDEMREYNYENVFNFLEKNSFIKKSNGYIEWNYFIKNAGNKIYAAFLQMCDNNEFINLTKYNAPVLKKIIENTFNCTMSSSKAFQKGAIEALDDSYFIDLQLIPSIKAHPAFHRSF